MNFLEAIFRWLSLIMLLVDDLLFSTYGKTMSGTVKIFFVK
jgi:hypothetical protein